jgi:hypothetical protein
MSLMIKHHTPCNIRSAAQKFFIILYRMVVTQIIGSDGTIIDSAGIMCKVHYS